MRFSPQSLIIYNYILDIDFLFSFYVVTKRTFAKLSKYFISVDNHDVC